MKEKVLLLLYSVLLCNFKILITQIIGKFKMEKKHEEIAFYETDVAKNLMGMFRGRAVGGIRSNFIVGHIYAGKSGLTQISGNLAYLIKKEERRALIITDVFTKKFAGKVMKSLDHIDMVSRVWSGVEAEVPLYTIDEGVKICEEFKPKVLIAIGGGSVIDAAKILLLKYEKPKANIYGIIPFIPLGLRKKVNYLVAIPTTSGTGSEVTIYSIFTNVNRDPPKKIELSHPELIPDYVILDTDFVKDMPPFLTMATGLDAFSHAIGSYISGWGGPLIDALNTSAIKEIIKYLPRAYKYGAKDLEAREHMQWAALIAGMGFNNSKLGIDHSLGHSFGGVFNIHHGLSVGIFLPYTITFQAKVSDRWKDLCPIFNVESVGKNRNILLGEFVQKVKNFILSIGGSIIIKDLKNPVISEEKFKEKLEILTKYAESDGITLLSTRYINKELFKKIFEYAWDGKDIDF